MILCRVNDSGLEYVKDDLGKVTQYKSIKELHAYMQNNPKKFENGVTYTLHDVKPLFIVRQVEQFKIEQL